MSATSSSSDKYLFLFNTDSDDLSGIKSALLDYYKFPAVADNLYECTGCSNFRNTYKTLVEKLCGTDPSAPVYTMPDVNGKVPSGETKMNTLIVVISGNADSSGLTTGVPAVTSSLTWSQLRDTIFGTLPQTVGPPKTYDYQDYTEIHVILASPYCNSFLTAWDGSVPVTNGTLMIPPTVTDQIDQAGREAFLGNIASSLRMETAVPVDSNGRITFNGIAAGITGAAFRTTGGDFYLGYSYLEIYDGNPDWWESDDIYINTYGNDLYFVGCENTIFVNVHTAGTHPVKDFWIGIKIFWSGLGPAETMKIDHLVAGGTLPLVLKAGESFLYQYDVTFTTSTHRCLVARVKFGQIIDTEIDDYSEWSIEANANEAQRNIDPSPVPCPPLPAPPPPDPGDGQDPDPDPEPDAEDDNNAGDRSLKNLRSFKEHVYSVLNTFPEKRRFRIALHNEFRKHSGILKYGFFRIRDGKKPEQLKIIDKPYQHIPIALESGEKADIMFYFAVKPKVRLGKETKLPLEVLVEIIGKPPLKMRKSTFSKLDNKFAPAGGLTVKIKEQAYSIYGHVFDRKGKPVPGAAIFIRTVNGRQAAVLKTDEKGAYWMLKINPDSYRMKAITSKWSSGTRIVNLFSRDLNIDFMEGK